MAPALIVTLLIGVVLLIAATGCVVMAGRLPVAVRIIAALVFGALAFFCLFGFAATFEPGDSYIVWRVGYAVLFLACLLAIGRLVFAKRVVPSSAQAADE